VGAVVHTPLLRQTVGGRDCWFKVEALQRTGSFKLRGALNFIASLDPADRSKGVVAYSSGNHAQGVAAAAKDYGIAATIVMPSDAPRIKIDNTRGHGAEVVLYERATGEREQIAQDIADRTGATIVPPFDHPWIIAGQGTAGLEIIEDLGRAGIAGATVAVPASGGGLTAGIALTAEPPGPIATVMTAEPETHDDHRRSFEAGERVPGPGEGSSMCDALLQPLPGEVTFAVNCDRVGGGVVASDDEVLGAMRFAVERLKVVVEPGGAVALAALLADRIPGDGPVVIVLSGGNVDPGVLAQALI
jgi:threonine dehydratase